MTKRKLINKIVAGVVISATLCTLNSVKASAEWVTDYQGNFYYMQGNEKLTGWKRIDGQLYYFDQNGKMQTGWIKAGSSWYYLGDNGAMKTGWIDYNKNWYYADANGAIQSGVINVSGKVYVFDNNGILQTKNTVINGEFYTISSNGEVVGAKAPTPNKEFDYSGNCVQVLKSENNEVTGSPTDSNFNNVIEDQTVSDDDPNEGRTFKVTLKDSNGTDLKTKTVKYNKTVDLYEPTKAGYYFSGWNTKSNGSGKNYAADDDIKVKEDITLYAQWSEDASTKVDSITIKGSSYVTINKTIQMTAEVLPNDAANKNIKWSVVNGSGKAEINSTGVLTGVSNGTVTVKATSTDGSNVTASKTVTVSATDVAVAVSKITVTSATGASQITTPGGTLQMGASVLPIDADDQDVTWSVDETSGGAEISETGLLTAKSNGTVTVKATAKDKSGVVGTKSITISGQTSTVPVESITSVTGSGGINEIKTDASAGGANGTLQMIANILPANATNKTVTWSVVPEDNGHGAGKASISTYTGLLTAEANGDVKVRATLQSDPQIYKEGYVWIQNQTEKLTDFEINSTNSSDGTIKMSISTTPAAASYKSIAWSTGKVAGSTGYADIAKNSDDTAKLTPVTNGDILVKAVVTAKNGSQIAKTKQINISGAPSKSIELTGISIGVKDNAAATITENHGTLQLAAELQPYYQNVTTSSAVQWNASTKDGAGSATISTDGILKAASNGYVKVTGTITYNGKTYTSNELSVLIQGQYTEIKTIAVKSDGNATTVERNGTLKMSADILPSDATFSQLNWNVISEDGNGMGTITQAGVLQGTAVGKIKVRATDAKNSTVYGEKEIEVIEPVKVATITVNGATDITTSGGKVTLTTNLTGEKDGSGNAQNPTNKKLTWTVVPDGTTTGDPKQFTDILDNGDGTATLTAKANGSLKVRATAQDGSNVYGESSVINISGQPVKVTGITVTGAGNASIMQVLNGALQMTASIAPGDASVKDVTWSTSNAAIATISDTGLLTANAKGTVIVKATAKDGSGIFGTANITINPIISFVIKSPSTAVTAGSTVKLDTTMNPTTAADPNLNEIAWSIVSGDNYAQIGSDGTLVVQTNASGQQIKVRADVKENSSQTIIKSAELPINIS